MSNKTDPDLSLAFTIKEAQERKKGSTEKVCLPFRIEVDDITWQGNTIPDCNEIGRMYPIIAVFGSQATVEALEQDNHVLRIF